MTRTGVLVAVVIVALAAATVGLVATADAARPVPPVDAEPADLAAEVCARVFDHFAGQVEDDAAAVDVLEDLDVTVELARRAAGSDPYWIALAGGVGALRSSLYGDDPEEADIAMRVLRAECARVGDA